MSLDDAQEPMDPGDLEPKHRVFLCHSGAQKGFVEQLDKDLRSVDRYPFFDKDRESLPIGDNFPSFIFEAIECCQVGVVFLSEEFFVWSHWPMFEVVKMVECGRRIMPIFLGISPWDLSNVEKVALWKSKWEIWAKSNGRIDVARWESTLRFLRPLNGLVYNDAIGEVKFREEIVKEVCEIVPPFHVWDDSHVQGRSRISKLIQVKISETLMSKKGVQVIGLYGVGDIGKTTTCKSLCKDLILEFDGRVCHIEFGGDTSEIDRVREVLKRLTNTNNEFLKDRKLDECWNRLKGLLRLNKVVLAIDNVSSCQKICDEVEKYLSLVYGQGSVVMVTARALGELRSLGIETSNCLEMPELVEDEARALFLNHAKPKSVVDERIVMECVNRCHFGKGDVDVSEHYHPLALKVLGSQLIGRHPMDWISQLEEEDVFNQLQEQDNLVFSVLRRSFDTLKDEYKMLFMDVALFDDNGYLKNWNMVEESHGNLHIIDEMQTWYTIFDWLRIVHGLSMGELKKRLSELKRRSLLEELGDGTSQIGMHDLWREFAVMETKRGEEGSSHWVHEDDFLRNQGNVDSCMVFSGWKKLRRICLTKIRVKHMNFKMCSKVTVLRLIVIGAEDEALDLSQMTSIKSLEIVQPGKLGPTFQEKYGEEVEQHKVSGIGQLLNLVVLVWWNIDDSSLSAVEEVSCLTNLQILHLRLDHRSYSKSPMSLDLQQLRYLQDVRVELPSMVSISGFSSRMKDLRILNLKGCRQLKSCVGVGNVDGLEVLLLHGCSKLEELPNLLKLTRLRILDINGCELLKALPGLGSLVALQVLYGRDASLAMKELPSISNLVKLEVLDLERCYELKCILGLGGLIALRELRVSYLLCHDLPDLRNLTKLQTVVISGRYDSEQGCGVSGSVVNLAMLESVSELSISDVDHELENLNKLTALKSLKLSGCNFERFPHMGKDMILESLRIAYCGRLRGWDGARGLRRGPHSQVDSSCDWTLPYLKSLEVMGCQSLELPDLRHFPQLKMLILDGRNSCGSRSTEFVVHCHAIHVHLKTLQIENSGIKELPDLRKFPSLQELDMSDCNNLTNLTINGPLPALSSIRLSCCRNLRTVPNINLFLRLTEFEFSECGVQLNEHEVQKLIARGFGDYDDGLFQREPSSDVVVPPAGELNWHADEQVAVDAPIDLAVGAPLVEPCTSDFIPNDESLSEIGISPVLERALGWAAAVRSSRSRPRTQKIQQTQKQRIQQRIAQRIPGLHLQRILQREMQRIQQMEKQQQAALQAQQQNQQLRRPGIPPIPQAQASLQPQGHQVNILQLQQQQAKLQQQNQLQQQQHQHQLQQHQHQHQQVQQLLQQQQQQQSLHNQLQNTQLQQNVLASQGGQGRSQLNQLGNMNPLYGNNQSSLLPPTMLQGNASQLYNMGNMGNNLGNTMGNNLGNTMGNNLGNTMGNSIGNALGNSMGNPLVSNMGTSLGTNAMGNTLGNSMVGNPLVGNMGLGGSAAQGTSTLALPLQQQLAGPGNYSGLLNANQLNSFGQQRQQPPPQ